MDYNKESLNKKEGGGEERGGSEEEGGINQAKLRSCQLFRHLKRSAGRSGQCN